MSEIEYRLLVWLTYRLAGIFALGLPLVLLIWSILRNQSSLIRLLIIYWKVSSLLAISLLLLADHRPMGYIAFFLAPFLMASSVWFWTDLNEELADQPPFRPLTFTVKLWRWALTGFAVLAGTVSYQSLACLNFVQNSNCLPWLEAPKSIQQTIETLFKFLFGAQWTEPISAFIGYITLFAYILGVLQLLLVKLPKQGRIAGGF